MGLIVTTTQGPEVPMLLVTFAPMSDDTESVHAEFAERMHEICADMALPPEHGRQTALAQVFGVTNKAARKWLLGLGFPEMSTAIRIANWAGVNVNWLLQGQGPKRGDRVDFKAMVLDEAIHSLPPDQGVDMVDTLRAKLVRNGRLTAQEPSARYEKMLQAYEQELTRKH